MSVVDNSSSLGDDVAILLDELVDKYHPGVQVFRLQSLTGLQENSKTVTDETVDTSNFMNKDKSIFKGVQVSRSSALLLPLSVEFTRDYKEKYIPVGTRFSVSFKNGDITKPVIIGRITDGEEGAS